MSEDEDDTMEEERENGVAEDEISDEKYEAYYEEVRASILAMKALEEEAREEAQLKRGTEHKRPCIDPCSLSISPHDSFTLRFDGK